MVTEEEASTRHTNSVIRRVNKPGSTLRSVRFYFYLSLGLNAHYLIFLLLQLFLTGHKMINNVHGHGENDSRVVFR